ncbi:MAG: uroporphyrinogen-III C-methyltransferase [Sarcina sp.]
MSKAYIIGTGPGDEELLTLKAVRALSECTAVLYDRLVSPNVLNYINEDCEIYYCGKEPGAHYKTQDEINEMIVALAKKGHIVGRVKGGDPYVFGRGGEEVIALNENNIEFEVIPGVTSPIAVLNYAGIPITHRAVAQSFHIITGMTSASEKIEWEALAKEQGTLVFMMGLNNLGTIVNNLIFNGKDKNTKAAIVMKGTTSKQKKVIGTLENIEFLAKENNLESPCIIVVGEVVKFSNEFAWFENKPLFGKNICITRSKEQSLNLKLKLQNLGAQVTQINSIKVKETSLNLENYIPKLREYEHIIFTSVNAVNIFFDYLIEKSFDIRNLKAKFYCIGHATEKALKSRGIFSFLTSKNFTTKGLCIELDNMIGKDEKTLLPCSSLTDDTLKMYFEEHSYELDRVNIYDTVCGEVRNQNAFDSVDIVLYTSPSTVRNMITMIGKEKLKSKMNIAIGPKTSKELSDNNIDAFVCKNHCEDGFLDEIEGFAKLLK